MLVLGASPSGEICSQGLGTLSVLGRILPSSLREVGGGLELPVAPSPRLPTLL